MQGIKQFVDFRRLVFLEDLPAQIPNALIYLYFRHSFHSMPFLP